MISIDAYDREIINQVNQISKVIVRTTAGVRVLRAFYEPAC
jgi:hypothetical protein